MEAYIKSDSAVFRKVENEVVVVQLESGKFFYFNAETEAVLSELSDPRSVDSATHHGSPLQQMLELMERERIVTRIDSAEAEALSSPSGAPALLRQGDVGVETVPSVMLITTSFS